MNIPRMTVLAAAVLAAVEVFAKVIPAAPFADHAVLQRGVPLPVWGRAAANARVEVRFAGRSVTASADGAGLWRSNLPALAACSEPRDLTIVEFVDGRETDRVTVADVLVGEVWLVAGQSNVECPVWGDDCRYRDRKGRLMTALARRPAVRFSMNPRVWKKTPDVDRSVEWKRFSPEAFARKGEYGLSAIAFYFALTLHDALDVPVGVVQAAWGGTNIDAWTPRSAYAKHPSLRYVADFPLVDRWESRFTRGAISDVIQQPTVLWNGMVAAWAPFALRGVLWYQGCSNNCDHWNYAEKMHALYDGWKAEFGNPALKFYFAELAPFKYNNWFYIQKQQVRFASEEPNAGMIVTADIGNPHDIHPNDKQTVGERFAALALKRDYGWKDVPAEAPSVKSWRIEGGAFVIDCENASSWYVYNQDWSEPAGFEVAGEDGVYRPAKLLNRKSGYGIYADRELRVGSESVKSPVAVRYLALEPYVGSLMSADSALPLGPFEIDTRDAGDRYRATARIGDALTIPELESFRRVYSADLPCNGRFSDVGYALDASADGSAFSRVAYVLQLEQADGRVDWIMTAFDTVTNDVKAIGVPAVSKALLNTRVRNLTVRSNLRSIREVTDYDGGSIEFWNCGYYTWTGDVVSGGSGAVFDFNDKPVEVDKPGCGSMQVHDWKGGHTLWSYCDFNSWCKCNSLGIGDNRSGGHPDWSYTDSAGRYRSRTLDVFVR